ncbi:MAG: Unknown protein [uncultured Sulfurovum sp.]|uniref:Uncharacterized protein n=1 Tax=uncultured Sulfurovum sp. TaxID=269237 RepID=A0A6S6UHD1_9BACT|nr:MAG: Unknown protein [uncultured Sulfurovum sp.]
MGKKNLWRLSTILVILVFFTVLTSTILLIPWGYFNKEKNSIEWLMFIVSTGSLFWSFLLYKFFLFYQNKQVKKKLKYTNLFNFTDDEDTHKVIKILNEKNLHISNIEYRVDGDTSLEDDSNRQLLSSPVALNFQGKNIVLIPGFFLARFRRYPRVFASVLTHELAHFHHKDLALIHKVQLFLKAVIILFTLSSILLLTTSIYADIKIEFNNMMLAIQASIIGKNYLLFQGLVLVLLLVIHKQLEIWREAQADAESIKYFDENTLIEAERLLNIGEKSIRATSFHRNNLKTLTPTWVFIAGVVIALFNHRLAGTMSYFFQINNHSDLLDIANAFSNILLFSGFFYILISFFKNIEIRNRYFMNLIFNNTLLLLLGSYTTFLCLETLPHIISSSMMPDGYDYILRYDPLSSFISSLQVFIVNTAIILLVLISLLIGYIQKKISLGFFIGIGFLIALLLEREFYPDLWEGWLSPILFSLIFILLYIYRRENLIYLNAKSYLLFFSFIVISSLDYFGLTNVNHFSRVQMQLGNHSLLKEHNISKSIGYYRKALELSPHNLDTTILLMKLLGKMNEIDAAIELGTKAKVSANYFEAFWNKRYEYYVVAGSLGLQRKTKVDLINSKKYFIEAVYLYRNNSRLEEGQNISKTLFYNLVCVEAQMKNYQDAGIYLLEFITYFKDREIFNDTDLVLLVKNIKMANTLSTNRLDYLNKLFKRINYQYTFVETKTLLAMKQITFEDVLFILKLQLNR